MNLEGNGIKQTNLTPMKCSMNLLILVLLGILIDLRWYKKFY